MTTPEILQLVMVNVFAWLLIQLAVPYLVHRLPTAAFNLGGAWFRTRSWERGGAAYQHLFAVRRWKDLVPDAAGLFRDGFRKRTLRSYDASHFERFARETCRGELAHVLVLACGPLFFLWNPPGVGWIMLAYALVANLPCILIQRYNRARLLSLLLRISPDKAFVHKTTHP